MAAGGFWRVRPLTLELLAVVAGAFSGALVNRPSGLAVIFVGFVGAGWWRSWDACLLAALFAAGLAPFAAFGAHPWDPLLMPLRALGVALTGAAVGAWARRWGPAPRVEEDRAVAAARRRGEAKWLLVWGALLLVGPFVGLVLGAALFGENPGLGILFTAAIILAWPPGVLLILLGAVRWWHPVGAARQGVAIGGVLLVAVLVVGWLYWPRPPAAVRPDPVRVLQASRRETVQAFTPQGMETRFAEAGRAWLVVRVEFEFGDVGGQVPLDQVRVVDQATGASHPAVGISAYAEEDAFPDFVLFEHLVKADALPIRIPDSRWSFGGTKMGRGDVHYDLHYRDPRTGNWALILTWPPAVLFSYTPGRRVQAYFLFDVPAETSEVLLDFAGRARAAVAPR